MRLVRISLVIVTAWFSTTIVHAAATTLMDAVRAGDRRAARRLINSKTVNMRAADGTTPLHWAVQNDDVEMANLLVAAGADVNANSHFGVTPLGLAAENANAVIVERLLRAGADPAVPMLADHQTVLFTAARSGSAEVVKLLLRYGADPDTRERWLGETSLMVAAAENHPAVVKALLEAGADPSLSSSIYPDFAQQPNENATLPMQYVSKGGMSALHFAARQGAKEAVRALADRGVDLDHADPDGMTALIFATLNAHYDTAALLLEKGANPNLTDASGQTVLYLCVDLNRLEEEGATIGIRGRPARTQDERSALDLAKLAIAKGATLDSQILKKLPLRAPFATLNDRTPEGATPVWRAAKTSDVDFVKLLLDAGADPRIPTIDGKTSLMAAAGVDLGYFYGLEFLTTIGTDEESVEVIRLLLDAGVDINQPNIRGETALHVAAGNGRDAVVKYLVDNGAKLDLKDAANRTPLDVAMGIPANRNFAASRSLWEHTAALLRELMAARGIKSEPYVAPTAKTAEASK